MKRLIYWPLILIGILAAFHLLLTGSPIPLWQIDRLHAPKAVASIENDGLRITDGSILSLPHAGLIREYPVIQEGILKYGVEVTASGEIFGLVHVHHWCGNDPVRYHLARVNLGSLATLLGSNPKRLHATNRGIDPGALAWLVLPPDNLKEMLSEDATSSGQALSSPPDRSTPP